MQDELKLMEGQRHSHNIIQMVKLVNN